MDSSARDVAGGVYLDVDGKLFPAIVGNPKQDIAEAFKVLAYKLVALRGPYLYPRSGLEPTSYRSLF